MQRWRERVIVKRTLPIAALKLTWGLLKLQPDIRLDKDARKGHYVATRDSIPPLISLVPLSLPLSNLELVRSSVAECLRGPLDASEREVPSDSSDISPAPASFSLRCPSLIQTFALSLTQAHKNNKRSFISAPNITLTTEELVRHYKSAPKSLDGFLLK